MIKFYWKNHELVKIIYTLLVIHLSHFSFIFELFNIYSNENIAIIEWKYKCLEKWIKVFDPDMKNTTGWSDCLGFKPSCQDDANASFCKQMFNYYQQEMKRWRFRLPRAGTVTLGQKCLCFYHRRPFNQAWSSICIRQCITQSKIQQRTNVQKDSFPILKGSF